MDTPFEAPAPSPVGDAHSHLTTVAIDVPASPDEVFDVLDDADAYPRWVVGTRRIRGVEADWPKVGTRFFHAVGAGAIELHDWTRVRARERPRRLELEVRFRPTGVAAVTIEVEPIAGGAHVTLGESPTVGPAAMLPAAVLGPALWGRNQVSLRRLRREVVRRTSAGRPER